MYLRGRVAMMDKVIDTAIRQGGSLWVTLTNGQTLLGVVEWYVPGVVQILHPDHEDWSEATYFAVSSLVTVRYA